MKNTSKRNPAISRPVEVIIDEIPLNRDTPSGLFETSEGHRLLVTPNEEHRVAIVLRHPVLRPFSWQRLRRRSIAKGACLGGFQVELRHRVPDRRRGYVPGTLGIGDRRLYLDCHPCDVDHSGIPMGDIDYSDPFTDYDGWRILKDGQIFFEQLARTSRLIMALSVTPMPSPG